MTNLYSYNKRLKITLIQIPMIYFIIITNILLRQIHH